MAQSNNTSAARKPSSLGVIFLTLYIDLIGFSIIFPLFPAMLRFYIDHEGKSGLLGWVLAHVDALARWTGASSEFTPVLFGGLLGSLYSFLQFAFAPFWGGLSDRVGRRSVLIYTVAGTALSYAVWFFSGSFWLLLLTRIIGGITSGNLAVATAAIADVTDRENRAKGMGMVGAAFGLGFVTGPAIGGMTAGIDLTTSHPQLTAWGVNPFSVPAAIAFFFCLVNLVWIWTRFGETLSPANASLEPRERHPLKALFAITNPGVKRANWLYYLFALAYSGMEFSLAFLAAERFDCTPRQMTWIFVFIGVMAIIIQGGLVRRLVPKYGERNILKFGLICGMISFPILGFATSLGVFYIGLTFLAFGSGFTNPAISSLISLYCRADEQGKVLGVFRSLGSLARAVAPVVGGLLYWWLGSRFLYVLGGVIVLIPIIISLRLPEPEK